MSPENPGQQTDTQRESERERETEREGESEGKRERETDSESVYLGVGVVYEQESARVCVGESERESARQYDRTAARGQRESRTTCAHNRYLLPTPVPNTTTSGPDEPPPPLSSTLQLKSTYALYAAGDNCKPFPHQLTRPASRWRYHHLRT